MKFAYMIMAHKNPIQLSILLKLLDYEENDIYLHIDKKSVDINTSSIGYEVKKAHIHIYCKYAVKWGVTHKLSVKCFCFQKR